MVQTTSVIPEGYTFMNHKVFISKRGKEVLQTLLKKSADRNPDFHDMYIYNDFHNYAVLDLVDKQLSTIHTKLVKRQWDDAFFGMEALTAFQNIDCNWPMIDDGDRAEITDQVYGACVVALLKGLKNAGRLNCTEFPSLESFLEGVAGWGESMSDMCGGAYHLVCKAVGKRLFGNKSAETLRIEKERVQEWMRSLDEDDRMELERALEAEKEEDDEADEAEKPWYSGAKPAEEDYDHEDYVLSRVWKEYKECLQGVPTKPLMGPASWDCAKWSAAQKAQFSLDRF